MIGELPLSSVSVTETAPAVFETVEIVHVTQITTHEGECPPSYKHKYQPPFTPSSSQCTAPFFHEHRSRMFEGEMYFL